MNTESRVAVLVDCDNTQPAVLEYAMKCDAAGCGRMVLKRAYGNHATLGQRWKDAIVQMGFAPCMQFQSVAGKNTSDIALALDALEALLDKRVEHFIVVTSDSDFVHLCHKLRERGAVVHIVGEAKTPEALRHACDRFFEFIPVIEVAKPAPVLAHAKPAPLVAIPITAAPVPVAPPQFVMDAVAQLSGGRPGSRVSLATLGNHLTRLRPGFSPKAFGYTKLTDMLRACPLLELGVQHGQGSTVRLAKRSAPKAA